jgi:hypothetical protein
MRLMSVAEAAQKTGIGRPTLDRKRYVDLDQLDELRRNPPVVE